MDKLFTVFAQLRRSDVTLPENSLNQDTINEFRSLALIIFGSVALIIVALAGFKYITSQGNSEETAKAQKTIIYTMVGLVVAVFAVFLISTIINRVT